MTIRQAQPADESAIIELLRISLGDSSTEKTAAFYRWKHRDNPFGPSKVLVAVDNGKVVGLRAFMRWTWQSNSRQYRALRAVDTATHPDYRGQGIFKRLTKQLIDVCKAEGDDFIFNTPNEQSRPGYLKMGWQQLGKLPVRVAPLRPLSAVFTAAFGSKSTAIRFSAPEYAVLAEESALTWLSEIGDRTEHAWHTPVTPAFLRWRYQDCPARTYHVAGHADRYLIFYYGRIQRVGTELRIVHYLVRPGFESEAQEALGRLRQQYRPVIMTAAPTAALPRYFLPSLPVGLILTFRELNYATPPAIDDWQYAIGDLELF